MSYEIRTPLNAILGFIELIITETKENKVLEYTKIIEQSSKSLLQIIEDILDFSKMESGKLNIEKVCFNAKEEFKCAVCLFRAKCSEKNINLILNIDKNLPETINTDPLRVTQVIANLLSNAVKFTENNKNITVTINYNNNVLNISVKDEGRGVLEEKLSHIFEAFTQADSSTTREYGGTGLGLSISNELVKLLDGKLEVKSKVGVGSEFYFSINAPRGEAPIEAQEIEENTQEVSFKNKKILLVEDNKSNQIFMSVVLKSLKLTFDIANDGLEAIEMFKNNYYDVILMDENMPNMNGLEATKEILSKEKEDNLKHTPIIALTANALKGDKEKFLKAGMDEYLSKPVNKKSLSKMLSQFLRVDA